MRRSTMLPRWTSAIAAVVERDGERRAVEVAARDDLAGLGEDERVVGRAAGLDFDGRARVPERVARRAVNLRHAAQAVGVLHARVALDVRGAYLALRQQLAQVRGRLDLTLVRAREVYALVEGGGSALQGFERHRARHVGRARNSQRAFERQRADAPSVPASRSGATAPPSLPDTTARRPHACSASPPGRRSPR